jgi:hypothetical protein
MKVFTTLFFGVCFVGNLSRGDDAIPRQFQLFHHPTRVPVIFHRIRERLTTRPMQMHHNSQNINHPHLVPVIPALWQHLHPNIYQAPIMSTVADTLSTLGSTQAVTTTSSSDLMTTPSTEATTSEDFF